MQKHIRSAIFFSFLTAAILFALSGCNSTRNQDGITIEEKSGNPLKFW